MIKYLLKTASICLCILSFVFSVSVKADEVIPYKADDIKEINAHIDVARIIGHKYNFIYNTNLSEEITYFMHALSSCNFIDDGNRIMAGDVPTVDIKVILKNNNVINLGFLDYRFVDDNDNYKQYAVDRNEYNRFLETVYALKNKLVKLPDDISFEPSEWARDDIDRSIKTGLLPKLNRIDYTGDITRLEVCELADNLIEKINPIEDSDAENPFSDTKNKSVVSLYNLGIIQGKSESEFKPYDFITREEFAKILMSVFKYTVNDKEETKAEFDFADENEISDWAKESVKSCADLGLFRGDEKGNFNPKDNISKEECIVTINRLYKIAESGFDQNLDTKINLTTYVNDIEIKGSDMSFYKGGLVEIPMEAMFESMGMKVTCDSENDTVNLDYNGYLFKCVKSKKLDDSTYEFKMINCLNGKNIEFYRLNGFDTCTVINDRIYLGSDIVCGIINFFDGEFIFDEANKTVKIYVDKNWMYKGVRKLKTYVNDIELKDDSALLEDGRYKIPFEAFFKSLGADVKYDIDNNLILKYKNKNYICSIRSVSENGENVYYMSVYNDGIKNGSAYDIQLSPWSSEGNIYIIDGKIYLSQLSAEYLMRELNGKTELDKKSMTIKLFADKAE